MNRKTKDFLGYWRMGLLGFVMFPLILIVSEQAQASESWQQNVEGQPILYQTLAIGSPAPDFSLKGTDGKMHDLREYRNSNILVVIFTCNHCPTAQMYEDRIKRLVIEYKTRSVAFVAIQPNSVAVVPPREMNHTDVDDSMDGMIARAKFRGFNFPYLYDGDTQSVASKFGPRATPHVFIFDRQRKLRYEGRIDDNLREEQVKAQDARAALDSLLAGRQVAVQSTMAFGCPTKWKSQIEVKQQEIREWESRPVNLEAATADVLKKLRSNPTGKTLMVNFWATWCGPCVEEFDELLQTYLWYRSRQFELVTVSADAPEARAGVLRFLREQHSGVRNLLFASEDVYELQAAFDKRWESGVPYTVIIDPDGEIIYERQGEVDVLELRRVLLTHLPVREAFGGNRNYWVNAIKEFRRRR